MSFVLMPAEGLNLAPRQNGNEWHSRRGQGTVGGEAWMILGGKVRSEARHWSLGAVPNLYDLLAALEGCVTDLCPAQPSFSSQWREIDTTRYHLWRRLTCNTIKKEFEK